MASKKGKDAFMSNTVAPAADAPSLDLESLDKQFRNLTMPAKLQHSKGLDSHKPSSKGLDSFKPSSSASKRHETSRQPSSRAESSTVKGSTKNPTLPSIRDTQPPPYTVSLSTLKASHSSHNLDSIKPSSVRHSSGYPEDKKSHIPLSRQTEQGSATIRQHSHVSSSRQQTERGTSHPLDKKSQIPSSSRQLSHSQKTAEQTMPASTARVSTEHYQVGNMERTFLEGMAPKTQYDAKSQKTHPTTSSARTLAPAPSSARTILIDPEDIVMAQRQTKYATLVPSEQAKQEVWAQSMIERTGSCPEGFAWKRIRDGYQCHGGHHIITDALLAEGLGGVYALQFSFKPEERWGPYYADTKNPKEFVYRGTLPKPEFMPERLGGGSGLLGNSRATAMAEATANAGRTMGVHGSGLHSSIFPPGSHYGSGYPGSSHHFSGHPGSRF